MSDVVKLRTRGEIDEEAAAWIWRMESGAVSGADPEEFEAWLRQDPRHRRAVDELSKVWEALDGLTEAQREVVVLRFVADLPLEAVGKLTSRTEGAVKAMQHRALEQLSRALAVSQEP